MKRQREQESAAVRALGLANGVNSGSKRYLGSFAEIGGGTETSRYFFQAGNSSATVAKTMSAYAKRVSDAIYLQEKYEKEQQPKLPYISRFRLLKMLDHEYRLLQERFANIEQAEDVKQTRGDTGSAAAIDFPALFVFANTVIVSNYGKEADRCHGWVGARVQRRDEVTGKLAFDSSLDPAHQYVDVLTHVVMLEEFREDQMETLGTYGVFLLHTAMKLAEGEFTKDPEEHPARLLVNSLSQNVDLRHKIRVDVIEVLPPHGYEMPDDLQPLTSRDVTFCMVDTSLAHSVMLSNNASPEREGRGVPEIFPYIQQNKDEHLVFPSNNQRVPVRFLYNAQVLIHALPMLGGGAGFDAVGADHLTKHSWGITPANKVVHLFTAKLSDYLDRRNLHHSQDFSSITDSFLEWAASPPLRDNCALLLCRYRDPAWLLEHVTRFIYGNGCAHLAMNLDQFQMVIGRDTTKEFIGPDKCLGEDSPRNRETQKKRGAQVWSDSAHDFLMRIARRTLDEKNVPSSVIRLHLEVTDGLSDFLASLPPELSSLISYMERTGKLVRDFKKAPQQQRH